MHSNILNQSKLTLDQVRKLNQINLRNRKKIENLLKIFYKQVNKNHWWFLSPIMSRDKVQCRLYSDLNFLELLDFYIKKKKIKKVIVENYLLKKAIIKKHKKIKIEISGCLSYIISDLKIVLKSFFKVLFCTVLMITAKDKNRKKNLKNKKITLIETFSLTACLEKKFLTRDIIEIYIKNFQKKLKKNVTFFLSIYQFYQLKNFLKSLRGVA